MGPSKDRRDDGLEASRRDRALAAEAAEESRRQHAEALRKQAAKKAEEKKGKGK